MVRFGEPDGYLSKVFKHQPDVTLDQASPVQNTWYTVLDTTRNCRLYSVSVLVATTGETLEVRITVDGVTITGGIDATADTVYKAIWYFGTMVANQLYLATADPHHTFLLEGRSVKVEVRKTTANGTGNLKAKVTYAKIP